MADEFNWTLFDKRSVPLIKRPEVTLQTKGTFSLNASAHHALGDPEALELLYDADQRVIGFRAAPAEAAHAYPIRPVGKGKTYIVSGRAFVQHFNIPADRPVRREAKMVDDTLVVDLKDPGRDATSNRDRAKRRVESQNGAGDSSALAGSPG
jgi:hypothetical protein